MKTIGMYLAIGGIGSSLLSLLGLNFKLLLWIDMWGEPVGWAIRGGITLLGALLFFLAPAPRKELEADPAASE